MKTMSFARGVIFLLCLCSTQSARLWAQTAPAAVAAPAVDFARLADPGIAAALGLSVEQAGQMRQLLEQRQAALTAATDEAGRAAAVQQSDAAFRSLLTEDQQRLFVALFSEKQLRFNFRAQKWPEVLDWVAREADLSLVMETPPPGVFSYSDSKDYSTTAAIDLLNGWLLTKGFTLVRRERMLMCLDLKSGLPEGAIPRISPTELATRGRFEFVTVLFPLENRLPETVVTEVQPLLGTYGKVKALPQTSQLMVSDTVANLRLIETVVGRIPASAAAASGPPELIVYPVTHANPEQAATVLKQIVSGTVVVDAKARQISVNAVPFEQAKARTILQQLETNQGPDMQPVLKLYPAAVADPDQFLATVKLIAPDGQFRIDSGSGRLVVWATAADQQKVSDSLQQLLAEQPQGGLRSVVNYPLQHVEPTAILTILASLTPTARVSLNSAGRGVVVFGTANEQQSVRDLIEQLDSQAGNVLANRTLQVYPVPALQSTQAVSLLATTVPRAQVVADPTGERLLVMAAAAEHEQVSLLLQALQAQPAEKQFRIHPVEGLDVTSTAQLLAVQVPKATVTVDAVNRRLLVTAIDSEQQRVQSLLQELQLPEGERERKLQSHPLPQGLTAAVAVATLTPLAPRATLTPDEAGRRLLVNAAPRDHQLVDEVLQQLAPQAVAPAVQLQVYPLKGSTPAAVLQVLQPLVDATVQVTADAGGRQLFVRATAEKQAEIAKMLQQITEGLAGPGRETRTYFVGAPNADEAQEALLAMYPDARLFIDADRKLLIATATPEQHVTIQKITDELKGKGLEGAVAVPQIYELKHAGAVDVQTLLQSLYTRFDGIRITGNDRTGRLVVVAKEDQHVEIRGLIEQLDQAPAAAEPRELAVFRLGMMDGLAAQQALQSVLSAAVTVTPDRIGRQLFISAPAAEMPAVREQVQQMLGQSGGTGGNSLDTRSYWLRPYEADEAQEVLERLYPDAVFVTDTSQEVLVATATAEQHQTVERVVQQMMVRKTPAVTAEPRTYRLRNSDGSSLSIALQSLFNRTDNVRISVDEQARALIAVARPEQHAVIAKLVSELEPPAAAEPRQVEMYALPGMNGDTAEQVVRDVLQSLDPAALISWERATQQLVISTTAAGQAAVKGVMERLQQSDPKEMDVIPLRVLSAEAAQNAIESLYGDSYVKTGDYPTIQADEDSQQLLLRGTRKQLQDIRLLLQKMGEPAVVSESGGAAAGAAVGGGGSGVRVIPVTGDVDGAVRRIQDLWPRIRRNPLRVLQPGGSGGGGGGATEPAPAPAPAPVSGSPCGLQDELPGGASQVGADVVSGADELPAVVVIPGVDRITIASEDSGALDQLESIVRTAFSRAGGQRGRDFSVYQLRNAGAEDVSETLQSVYTSRAGLLAFGSVVIVPETRLNALIVYGSRTDRDRIEQLLEILDTEKLPDSGRIFRTEVVEVRHADAAEIEDVIQGVYRTELSAGGSRRAIEIPAGIDSSVASVLRQINAQSSAPLLTVEVQRETNSLVLKAPQTLIEEIRELVRQLDDTSSASRARSVRLVPLERTNSRRVMQVLDEVLGR
jgi:type II secretory pathway component GspD/PulD (secretin)